MKFTLERELPREGSKMAAASRFEQPDIRRAHKSVDCGQFGRRLKKIFPVPAENPEPEHLQRLVRRIEEIFGNGRSPPGD